MKRKQRGITLVALIITIIILLILAGISISTLTGSGLFENARLAEQKSKNEKEKEEAILGDYENKIEHYINSNREDTISNQFLNMKASDLSQNGIVIRTDRVGTLVGGYITFGNWCYFNITLTSTSNISVTKNAALISEGLPKAVLDTSVQIHCESGTIGNANAYVMKETGNLCINIPTEIPSGTTMHFSGFYLTK